MKLGPLPRCAPFWRQRAGATRPGGQAQAGWATAAAACSHARQSRQGVWDQDCAPPPSTARWERTYPSRSSRARVAAQAAGSYCSGRQSARSRTRACREHKARGRRRQGDTGASLASGKHHQARRFRFQRLQGRVGAQRIRAARAIEMRAPPGRVMHVAAQKGEDAGAVVMQRPVACRERHRGAGIDHPAIGILRRDELGFGHDALERGGAGRHPGRGEVIGMDQRIPVGPQRPGVVDGDDGIKWAARQGACRNRVGAGAKDEYSGHGCHLPTSRADSGEGHFGQKFLGPTAERRSSAGYIENEVPQPQELVAFGFSITNRAPISSSE